MSITYFGPGSSPHGKRKEFSRELMAIQFELSKRGSVSLNRLANRALNAIQLHRTLDLERTWVRRIPRNAHKHHPLAVT